MSQSRLRVHLLSLIVVLLLLMFSSAILFTHVLHTVHAATTINVLFDNAHAETAGNADWIISTSQPDPLAQNPHPQIETDWTGGLSAWGVALQKTGRYSLKTNTAALTDGISSNPLDLSNFNVLVLPEPNTLFTAGEKSAILNFVQHGGGLFMIADHNGSDRNNDGADSLHIFNDLMNNNGIGNDLFGIQFDALNIVNENPSNDTPNGDPVLGGPFGNAQGSIIRNGTTETLNLADNANAHGIIYRNSFSNTGTTGVFVSGSRYGTGRVLAVGDSSAIDDGTCSPNNTCFNGWNDPAGQNNILFPNGTEWLAGGSSGSTPSPTPTGTPPPPTSNLIQNGGFEQGSASWVESSSRGFELVDSSNPHTGSHEAFLCGYNNCADSIAQTVAIPASTNSATLTYFWFMSTMETSHAFDFLHVQILSSSGSVLTTLQTISDGSTAGSWQSASFDVRSFQGQTIRVAFAATSGRINPTNFYIDDVVLNIR